MKTSELEMLKLCREHGAAVIHVAAEQALRGNHAPLGRLNVSFVGMPQLRRLEMTAARALGLRRRGRVGAVHRVTTPDAGEMGPPMSARAFDALAQFNVVRVGAIRESCRMVLVEGIAVREAAMQTGARETVVRTAVRRFREVLELARTAVAASD